ncbi:MAG: GNAT family N-acetyltransferase, partial [Candidatus Bathyarchaeia archaeon]
HTQGEYLRALLWGSDFFYAALIDGDVVGYAAASRRGDLVHILSIAVLPPFRHKEVGGALFGQDPQRRQGHGPQGSHP